MGDLQPATTQQQDQNKCSKTRASHMHRLDGPHSQCHHEVWHSSTTVDNFSEALYADRPHHAERRPDLCLPARGTHTPQAQCGILLMSCCESDWFAYYDSYVFRMWCMFRTQVAPPRSLPPMGGRMPGCGPPAGPGPGGRIMGGACIWGLGAIMLGAGAPTPRPGPARPCRNMSIIQCSTAVESLATCWRQTPPVTLQALKSG